MLEETGIALQPAECTLLDEYWHPEQKTQSFIYYAQRKENETPIVLTEGRKICWVPFAEALTYDLTHWTHQALLHLIGRKM